MSHNMILGTDFMSKFQVKIDFTDSTIKFTNYGWAPVIDTSILPKEPVQVRACLLNEKHGVPDSLQVIVAV